MRCWKKMVDKNWIGSFNNVRITITLSTNPVIYFKRMAAFSYILFYA